jgi:hypothetical protein
MNLSGKIIFEQRKNAFLQPYFYALSGTWQVMINQNIFDVKETLNTTDAYGHCCIESHILCLHIGLLI